MTRFAIIAHQVGELVEQKNAAYGDSIGTAGRALAILYPDGIKREQMDDALLVARVWDKLSRVATAKDALGEDPWLDIAGYGILGLSLHTTKTQQPTKGKRVAGTRRVSTPVPKDGLQQHDRKGQRNGALLLERMQATRQAGTPEKDPAADL